MATRACNRAVFQRHPSHTIVRIPDVEDAFLATRLLPPKLYKDYFESHNIDLENVQKYYHIVKSLNQQYNAVKATPRPHAPTSHTHLLDFYEEVVQRIKKLFSDIGTIVFIMYAFLMR